MTRNELTADISIGDVVRIRTEYDDVVGKVESLDETTVKIIRVDTGKPKRISYEIIVEYDFETDIEVKEKICLDDSSEKTVDPILTSEDLQTNNVTKYYDRIIALWGELERDRLLTVTDGYKEFSKTIPSELKGEMNSIKDKIMHAIKIHEFTDNNYRVKGVMTELSNYRNYPAYLYARRLKAMISYELANFEDAEELFYDGRDLEGAFWCALERKKYSSCLKYAMMTLVNGDSSNAMIKWLAEYASNNSRSDIFALLVKKETSIRNQALLYWFRRDICLSNLPDVEILDSEINGEYLFRVFSQRYGEVDCSALEEQYTSLVRIKDESAINVERKKQQKIYTGYISKFDPSKNNGLIDSKVYFYINQVMDEELQRLLYTSTAFKYKVSYTIGKNKFGREAADRIQLIEQSIVERKKGFISDFNRFEEFGRVSSDGKEYNFVLDSVSDPYLKADIMESYNLEEIDVSFLPDKKDKKKIASDLTALNSYDPDMIKSWIKSNIITQGEVDAWEKKKKQKEESSFVQFSYEPLSPLEEEVLSHIENDTISSTAMMGYCNRGHFYLVTGDLQNAEIWYLKAIEIKEKLETAVPDLNSIYMRTGQLDKSIDLLDKYSHNLKRDVYLNLKVQTLDKLKKHDEEFISVCEELLKDAKSVTKQMHYLLKLGQSYNDLGKYEKGLEHYEQWERIKKLHFGTSVSHELAHINMLQGKAFSLYKLGRSDKAKIVAEEILKLKSTDSLALAIINGESVETIAHEGTVIDWDEYWRATQISKYIEDCLEKTNLEVDKGIPHVVDGVYSGNEKDAIEAIRHITGRKTANNQAKYDNFIAAAKLVKQILDREEHIENDKKINEQIYQFYIAKAMLHYGDYQLINANTTGNYDMARYCYFQVTNVFKDVDKVYSCWLDSFLRYIQTYFSDFDVIKKRVAPADDTCAEDKAKELINNLCNEFDGELQADVMNFTIGLIVLFAHNANNKKYGAIVLDRLEKSHLKVQVEEALDEIIKEGQSIGISVDWTEFSFKKKWEQATTSYSNMQNDFSTNLTQSVEKIFAINTSVIHKLQNHAIAKNFFNVSEKICCEEILKLFFSVVKYNETSDFDAKNDLLRQMLKNMEGLKDIIESSATMYTYEFVYEQLKAVEPQIYKEAEILYEDSKPVISISVPAGQQSPLNKEAGEAIVPVNFTNKENIQNAENVKIIIETEKPFSFSDDRALSELKTIRSNDKGESILLHFNIEGDIEDVKMLEFSVRVSYQYKVSILEEKVVEEEPVRIPVPLYNQDEFKPIENPFAPYISGDVVSDKNMFFGRSKDIDEIIEVMSAGAKQNNQGRALALYGQTRTGKSSLLYHVENGLRERDLEHNIIINTGSIGDQNLQGKDITDLLYTILYTLEKEIKRKPRREDVKNLGIEQGQLYHPVLVENMKKDGVVINADEVLEDKDRARLVFNRIFKDFCEYVQQFETSYNVVLMIDEFTYIYDWIRQGKMDSSITQWWKALLQNNNIFAIIIGQDHMMQFVNDISISPVISNDFQTTELRRVTYLNEEDAKKLMSEPILLELEDGKKESRYNKDAIERLYELTSGSAFLIMNFCGKLVNYLNQQKSMYITKAHIDDFLKKNLAEFEESRFFEPQYNDKSEVNNTELVKKNKEILKSIARNSYNREWANIKSLMDNTENVKLIDKLVERDVLVRKGEDRCKIKVALYKEWLIERYGLEG